MSLSFFKSTDKKRFEEKDHREPIMVRIFREDNENTTVTVGGEAAASTASDSNNPEGEEPFSRPRFSPNPKYFNISVYVVITSFILLLMAVVIFNFKPVLDAIRHFFRVMSPFFIGALVAFTVSPIVNWLDYGFFEKLLHVKRAKLRLILSIVITYIVLISLIVLALTKLLPQLSGSIADLSTTSQRLFRTISNFFKSLSETFPDIDFEFVGEQINNLLPTLLAEASAWVTTSIPKIFSTSYAIAKGIVNFLLMICISVYMVVARRRIARGATALAYAFMKPAKAASFIKTCKTSGQIFFGFIIGKSIDSIIIGILCFTIIAIAGFPYPVLISVIVGVTNMIPFFGPFIGAAPGIFLYLCIDPIYAVFFALIIFGLQQFDGWFLGPMILGDSTGVKPLWVILGITLGGAYFGVVGMFLGVPFTAVIVYLLSNALNERLSKRKIEVS